MQQTHQLIEYVTKYALAIGCIATGKRLGAVVEVFDTRPAVKEEVQSLGAKFIEVPGAADASTAGGYAVEQSEEYKNNQQAKIAERDRAYQMEQAVADRNVALAQQAYAQKQAAYGGAMQQGLTNLGSYFNLQAALANKQTDNQLG